MADAVETLENTFQIVRRNSDALILNTQNYTLVVRRIEAHSNIDRLSRIFNGIVEDVEDRRAKIFGAPQYVYSRTVARHFLVEQNVRRQMMPGAGGFHTFAHQSPEIDRGFFPARFLVPG